MDKISGTVAWNISKSAANRALMKIGLQKFTILEQLTIMTEKHSGGEQLKIVLNDHESPSINFEINAGYRSFAIKVNEVLKFERHFASTGRTNNRRYGLTIR